MAAAPSRCGRLGLPQSWAALTASAGRAGCSGTSGRSCWWAAGGGGRPPARDVGRLQGWHPCHLLPWPVCPRVCGLQNRGLPRPSLGRTPEPRTLTRGAPPRAQRRLPGQLGTLKAGGGAACSTQVPAEKGSPGGPWAWIQKLNTDHTRWAHPPPPSGFELLQPQHPQFLCPQATPMCPVRAGASFSPGALSLVPQRRDSPPWGMQSGSRAPDSGAAHRQRHQPTHRHQACSTPPSFISAPPSTLLSGGAGLRGPGEAGGRSPQTTAVAVGLRRWCFGSQLWGGLVDSHVHTGGPGTPCSPPLPGGRGARGARGARTARTAWKLRSRLLLRDFGETTC